MIGSSLAVLSCPKCRLEFSNVDELDSHIESSHANGDDDDAYDVTDVTYDDDGNDDLASDHIMEISPNIILRLVHISMPK